MTFQAQVTDQVRQQRRRQVIDAVIAGILEHVKRDGFAGTGKAADEHDLHGGKDSGLGEPLPGQIPAGQRKMKAAAGAGPCRKQDQSSPFVAPGVW